MLDAGGGGEARGRACARAGGRREGAGAGRATLTEGEETRAAPMYAAFSPRDDAILLSGVGCADPARREPLQRDGRILREASADARVVRRTPPPPCCRDCGGGRPTARTQWRPQRNHYQEEARTVEHVDLLPAALVAGFSVATKFAVDMVARAYQSWKGKEMPGWAKQLISLGVATAVTVQARVDLFAGLRGEETTSGYILTAMILAGLASEVAHPAIEVAKELRNRLASQASEEGAK